MRLYNYLPGHLSITVGKFAMGHFLRSGIARLLNFKTISEKAVVPLIWKCSIFIRNHSVKSTNVRHFFDAERILQNYPTSQTYPWDDIINKILETNEKFNINSVVLNTCLNLNLVEACVSYYKYLKTQNNKVTPTEYYLILSVLSKCEDQTESYRDCIQDIFKEIKHLLPINPLLFSCAAKVYYLIEGYWTEMLKIYQENFSESKIEIVESFLVAGAFRHNKPLLGWMLTKENPLIFRKEALVCYIDYCLEMAKNNKFTPLMIDDIVLFYNKTVNTFPYSNLMFKMKELADILNKNKYQNLQWNANECLITKEGYCSHCKLNIGKSVITKDEFESLKSSVLNDIVINKNINLKTSKSEFNRFMLFLQNCSPYSLVIDGLNINNLNSMEKRVNVINYFKKKNMKILLIARKHIRYSNYFKFLESECQLFLTDNLSDDDVFLIYATLHGGLDTYFLSRDYLRGYSSLLENREFKNTFKKWQLSHQYILSQNGKKIIPPLIHSNLPQITKSPNKKKKEFHWHLSVRSVSEITSFQQHDVHWLCLSGT